MEVIRLTGGSQNEYYGNFIGRVECFTHECFFNKSSHDLWYDVTRHANVMSCLELTSS